MNVHTYAVVLILIFLLINYLMSSYDKVMNWQTSNIYWREAFVKFWPGNLTTIGLLIILAAEVLVATICGFAIHDIAFGIGFVYAGYAMLISAGVLLFEMFALRILKKYAAATRVGVYFIISLGGLLFLK